MIRVEVRFVGGQVEAYRLPGGIRSAVLRAVRALRMMGRRGRV